MSETRSGRVIGGVGAPVPKKDAPALLTGKPVYVADIAPRDCLCVKLMHSPHAHAMIEEIAQRVPLGCNLRASEAYRRKVAPVLMQRAARACVEGNHDD